MKKAIAVILCVALVACLWQGWKYWKRGKRHEKHRIQSTFALCDEQVTVPSTPEFVTEILKQPFLYLGKGRQSFAFESSDGKWVIKLFQQKRLTSEGYLSWLPDQFLVKVLKKRKAKQKAIRKELLQQSHEIALTDLPQETGVVFAHLKRCGLRGDITLLDRRGKIIILPVDSVKFVLQQKAEPLKKSIVLLMHDKRVDDAKERIAAIFDLLKRCREKKIWDCDKALIRNDNIGFVEGRAIYIDTGKLAPFAVDDVAAYERYDLERLRPLHKWLQAYYPDLATTFQERADLSY